MTENEAISVLKMIEAHGSLSSKAKEMSIKALEEIQQYRVMEERLKKIYGECDGLLEVVVSGLERHEDIKLPSCIFKSRLLTDEDVDMWDEYRAIGTVEEFKALKEKNTPKKPFGGMYDWTCPACGTYHSTHGKCCSACMQMILWD